MTMKIILSALIALSVLGGIAARASADDYGSAPAPQMEDWHKNFGL
jgi:hypothetical protein